MISLGKSQKTLSTQLIDSEEQIHFELVDEAKRMKAEFEELLELDTLRSVRRPPVALSVKVRNNQFGPTLVWVRYTPGKITKTNGDVVRFTDEVRGRVNFRYPARIFKGYEPELRLRLIELENRAVELRKRTVFWRDCIAKSRLLLEGKAA